MIDLSAAHAEFAELVDKFKAAGHALLSKIEGQAADDVHTIGQQVSGDVRQAEQDIAQPSDPADTVQPPTATA